MKKDKTKAKTKNKQLSKKKSFEGRYNQTIMIPPGMNTADYLKSYGEIGWLFACVGRISQNVADSEWKAYKGDEAQQSSMALSVLKKPNPFMSQYELLEKTSMFLELRGKAFWYISKDGIGRPKEIWCISPLDMWIVPDKDNFIKGYLYKAGAVQVPLDVDEVIFFNYPDPLNPYDGIGPAQACANSLETDKYSAQWNRNFFYNSAEPAGILSLPDIGEDDYDRVVEQWNDKYGGVDNAKRTAIVKGGTVTYTPIQISQKDMDFFNLRQMNRDEILGAFGIHKSILGITDDVNRSNAETAEYSFAKHVVRPRLRRIQEKLNNEFIIMFNEDTELKFTDPVPENGDFILSVVNTQVNKTMTPNQGEDVINKLMGWNLPDIPGGDTIYQTVSLQPIGTPLPSPATPVTDTTSTTEQSDKSKKKDFTKSIRLKIADQIEKNNTTRHDDFLKLAEPLIGGFKTLIKGYFNDMQNDVVKKIEDGSKDPVDIKKWNKVLQSSTVPMYVKCFKVGGDAVVSEFKTIGDCIHKDLGVKFDIKDARVQNRIQNKVNNSTQINESTKQRIKDIVEEMYNSDENFTVKDIAAKIGAENFPEFDEARCNIIAQTEALGSLNQATMEGYHQNASLIDGKYWLATYSDGSRETHMEAAEDYSEDNAISVDDNFNVGGYDCQCPMDDSLPPEEAVNCHCCMAPVVKV